MGHRTRLGTRAELGFTGGGPQWLVTELGVFDYPDGQARLVQVFPDVSVAEVRAATGFDLQVGRGPAPGAAAVRGRAGRGPLGGPARGPQVRVLAAELARTFDPGTARTAHAERPQPGRRTAGAPGGLAAVFEPRRVALVGASDRPGSVGRLLWDNLADFPGEVLPVGQADRVGGQAGLSRPGRRPRPRWTWPWSPPRPPPSRASSGPRPPRASPRWSCSARASRRPAARARSCRPRRWPRPGRAACGWSGPTASACRTPIFR